MLLVKPPEPLDVHAVDPPQTGANLAQLIGLSAAAVFVPYGYVVQVETAAELLGRVVLSAHFWNLPTDKAS